MDHLNKNVVTKTKSEDKIYNTNFASAFYFLAFMFLVVYTLSTLNNILTPLAIAILIWFLINALANQIKRLPYFDSNIGNMIAIPLSLVVIVYLMFEIGSFIASNMVELSGTISQLDSKFTSIIEKLSSMAGFDVSQKFEKLFEQFSLASLINKVISAFSSIVSNIMQILLYVLFLLIDQRFFNAKINALFKNYDTRAKAKEVLESVSKTIRMYLSITTIISLFTGILTYFICEFFSLQGAVLWGFLAFILNFIPTIGSIIAVVIPTLFSLVQFNELSPVLFLLASLAVVQFTVGNIIYPRLMGNKLNISQFVVILSLVLWGAMWGTVGMFLSVPLMMILLIILSQFENTKGLAILISGDGKIFDPKSKDKKEK
ncbi:AI-2E family transporter [Arcobacter roscoffensis]|uniref:AI-2E family transporter n=1 Tax=Arcobacter roscoffensis TaxID=2961520 RepID=A0ABY5E0V8_9BACT|nr:AI-2E family transporter [Arcobacter roscoffensis]UTJ05497.1 AI-2E family transporter [Arcobacter roscoffensis]